MRSVGAALWIDDSNMKYRLLAIAFIIFLRTFVVFAHGDEPRIEISVDRMNPGGVVEVRGIDFEFEEQVSLILIGSRVEIPLGEIAADTEGVFLQIVTIPPDLMEGVYQFRAVTDDHQILSPELLVQGPVILNEEGGGQGQREEDDGLLAPMPTFAPGVVPNDALSNQATTLQAPQPTSQSLTKTGNLPELSVVMILLGVGVLVVLGVKIARKRK